MNVKEEKSVKLPTYTTLEEAVSHLYQLHTLGYEAEFLARALLASSNLPRPSEKESETAKRSNRAEAVSRLPLPCSIYSLYTLLLDRFFALADRSLLPATPATLARIYCHLRSSLSHSLSRD